MCLRRQGTKEASRHLQPGRWENKDKWLHKLLTSSAARTTQSRSDCWLAAHTQLYTRSTCQIESAVTIVAAKPNPTEPGTPTFSATGSYLCVRVVCGPTIAQACLYGHFVLMPARPGVTQPTPIPPACALAEGSGGVAQAHPECYTIIAHHAAQNAKTLFARARGIASLLAGV